MGLTTLKGVIYPIDRTNSKGLMATQIKIKELLRIYHVDSTVNRDINIARLPKIVNYLNGYDAYPGVFLPSIVCVYSGNPVTDYDLGKQELIVPENERLTVIDGQHRIRGIENFINSVKIDSNRKNQILESDVSLQLYFGLSQEQMRNLFVDMNSNSVRVSMSLITAYDKREVLNVLARELYAISKSLQTIGVEFNKSKIMRPKNSIFFTSVRLKKFISILLFNGKFMNASDEIILKEQYDSILSFLERFFHHWVEMLPENPGDVISYILGHEAVQNAIAYVIHKHCITESKGKITWVMDWEEKIEDILSIDWSVNNSVWSKYLIRARANTSSEFFAIDLKDEKNIISEIETAISR